MAKMHDPSEDTAKSSDGTMEVRFIKLNRASAEALLKKHNSNNRTLSQPKIDKYAKLMREGKWQTQTDAIGISDLPRLINAQHRLHAVVQSNTTQEFLIITGLKDKAFDVIDTGKNRSAADVLFTHGVKNSGPMATMAKFILTFSQGKTSDAATQTNDFTHAIVADFVITNLHSLANSREYGYAKENKFVPGAFLGGLHYIFKGIHKERADEFVTNLVEGTNLVKGSPIWLLRQALEHNRTAQTKYQRREMLALIIKAWNAFFNGTTIHHLVFKTGENFPEIHGLKK